VSTLNTAAATLNLRHLLPGGANQDGQFNQLAAEHACA
jgi:hypothetical protein